MLKLFTDKLIRNAGFLIGVFIVNAVAGFLFWTLTAQLFDTSQVGVASSVISVTQLVANLASLGLGIGLVRFYSESEDPESILNTVISVTVLACVVLGILSISTLKIWSPELYNNLRHVGDILGFIILVVLAGIANLFQLIFLSFRDTRYGFWHVLLMQFSRLILIFAFIPLGMVGIVSATLIGFFVADIISFSVFLPRISSGKKFRLQLYIPLLKGIFSFSFFTYLADFFYRAPTFLIPILALEILGVDSSAHAYIAWMIGAVVMSPGLALGNSAFAEGSHDTGKLKSIMTKAEWVAGAVTILFGLAVWIGADFILSLFGSTYAKEAAGLLRWLSIAAPIAALNRVRFSDIQVKKNVGELLFLSVLSAVVSMTISYLWLAKVGLVASGYGWMAAQVIVFVVDARRWIR